MPNNFDKYLNLYSKVYPRYMPYIFWNKDGEKFLNIQSSVNSLFYYMPYCIGIPQAVLNLFVLTSIILIIKHPYLGFDTFTFLQKTLFNISCDIWIFF